MAKSMKEKKKSASDIETTAAYSKKTPEKAEAADDNASKYQPTEDADMNEQSLDPEDGLLKLFTDSVKDIYWAENHLVKALPKMAKAASSQELSKAILTHLDQTKTQVVRLEQVFEMLGKKPQAKKCDAMEGLTMEGEGVIEDTDSGTPARNLGIIMASQKVEHYEISSYNGLIKLANKLGLNDVAGVLSQNLAEEQQTDEILAGLADTGV